MAGPSEPTASVRAVVLDIGGVLEHTDDSLFPPEIPDISLLQGDALLGEVSPEHVRATWKRELALDDAGVDDLLARFWVWYVGTLNEPLAAWFAALPERGIRIGILSNSGPGAREAERHHGFEAMTDVLVYSHEVGLAKPDPAVYALTAERLGVEPHEIVFVDDWEGAVQGARDAGWRAFLHTDTERSIARLEALLAGSG